MQGGMLKYKKLLIILSIIVFLITIYFITKPYRLNLAKTYTEIGDGFANQGEYYKAALEYRKARILSPGDGQIAFKAAQAYQDSENWQAAYSYYKKAVKLDSQNKNYYLALANLYLEQDEPSEAIFTLREGLDKISAENDRSDLNILLGQIYLIKNEITKAEKAFETADSDYWMGIYYAYLEDYQKAKTYFAKSTDDNAELFQEACEKILNTAHEASQKVIFAQMLNQTNRARLALPILQNVTSGFPDYRDGWVFLGYSQLELKKYDRAIEALQSALDLDPIYPLTYELLARTYEGKGEAEKAKEYSDKAGNLK